MARTGKLKLFGDKENALCTCFEVLSYLVVFISIENRISHCSLMNPSTHEVLGRARFLQFGVVFLCEGHLYVCVSHLLPDLSEACGLKEEGKGSNYGH